MNANSNTTASDNHFVVEETLTVRELVAKVRTMPPEDANNLCECLIAARASDEEAEAAITTIEEILNPAPGKLLQM